MVSGRFGAMPFGVLAIGIGTAFRKPERSKTMKTKTNLKAGAVDAFIWFSAYSDDVNRAIRRI